VLLFFNFDLKSLSLTHQPDSKPDGLKAASALEDSDARAGGGALDRERRGEAAGPSADDGDVDEIGVVAVLVPRRRRSRDDAASVGGSGAACSAPLLKANEAPGRALCSAESGRGREAR